MAASSMYTQSEQSQQIVLSLLVDIQSLPTYLNWQHASLFRLEALSLRGTKPMQGLTPEVTFRWPETSCCWTPQIPSVAHQATE